MTGINTVVGLQGHRHFGTTQSRTTQSNTQLDSSYIWNDSNSGDQTSFSNPLQYDTQPVSSGADQAPGNSAHKKAHGKDKTGQCIPPGLAKKKAADLPDGNPWKAALEKQEKAPSSNNGGQTGSQAPAN